MKDDVFSPPCEECGGKCCKYIAIEIDKPTTKRDYDHIRWYLLHKNVSVFVDHFGKWHVEFHTECTRQRKDNSCSYYEDRPRICRGHGMEEGECEYYDSPYALHFTSEKEFIAYLEKKKINWRFRNL